MRLIDADDCKDLMYVMCAGQDKAFVRTMEQVIDDCPDVDASPVLHGRWIDREGPDEDLNVTEWCSVCWHSDTHSPTTEVPYCWFCGAKMDLAD